MHMLRNLCACSPFARALTPPALVLGSKHSGRDAAIRSRMLTLNSNHALDEVLLAMPASASSHSSLPHALSTARASSLAFDAQGWAQAMRGRLLLLSSCAFDRRTHLRHAHR